MAAYGAADIPLSWDPKRDTAFFRITAPLFPRAFTEGASVLLASHDEPYETSTPVASPPAPAASPTMTVHHSPVR